MLKMTEEKQTTARITKEGKHYEILVDLDEALKIKKDEGGNINSAVLTDEIFHNLKNGEKASEDELEKEFGSSDIINVSEKIIKQGEIVLPQEYMKKQQEQKYKQVVDYLTRNAVSPEGKPYTPDRIMKALEEANVNVQNKPISEQVKDIIEQLQKIIPIKTEMKKIKITIPAQHTGKAYGIINKYKEKEEWKNNGDLDVIVSVPAGIIMDFYDSLNSTTQGSALTEEMKE